MPEFINLGKAHMTEQHVFTASNLGCDRGYKTLFNHLSFDLISGQLLQIEGLNGCGKTSLLRLLCGLAIPTQGNILWDQQETSENRSLFNQAMLYLGHRPAIKADLNAQENLIMLTQLAQQPKPIEQINQTLAQLDLYGYEDLPCRLMSAGQNRRVALCLLILLDKPLWILDEPFTAIDKKGVQKVENLMQDHLSKQGLIVLTTHQDLKQLDQSIHFLNPSQFK
jgi:heme exporter protein A